MKAQYRYMGDRLRAILKLNDPPHRLAAAFALGIFISFSPWLGLHILSGLFLAWLFRVSKLVVVTASLLNNPWTIMPMYAFCLWFGIKITGSHIAVPEIAWSSLGFRDLFLVLRPFLWPFVVGTLAVGAVASVISFFLFYWAVRRYRRADEGQE